MLVMKLIVEGFGLGALLVLICAVGIRNGAIGMAHLYDKKVQERVIQLGMRASSAGCGALQRIPAIVLRERDADGSIPHQGGKHEGERAAHRAGTGQPMAVAHGGSADGAKARGNRIPLSSKSGHLPPCKSSAGNLAAGILEKGFPGGEEVAGGVRRFAEGLLRTGIPVPGGMELIR